MNLLLSRLAFVKWFWLLDFRCKVGTNIVKNIIKLYVIDVFFMIVIRFNDKMSGYFVPFQVNLIFVEYFWKLL